MQPSRHRSRTTATGRIEGLAGRWTPAVRLTFPTAQPVRRLHDEHVVRPVAEQRPRIAADEGHSTGCPRCAAHPLACSAPSGHAEVLHVTRALERDA